MGLATRRPAKKGIEFSWRKGFYFIELRVDLPRNGLRLGFRGKISDRPSSRDLRWERTAAARTSPIYLNREAERCSTTRQQPPPPRPTARLSRQEAATFE